MINTIMRIHDLYQPMIESKMPIFYHGTSKRVLDTLENGVVSPVFKDANVSLGGAYLTTDYQLAKVYAKQAARSHKSEPIVVQVTPDMPLYPDEDWVVKASERPSPDDFDYGTETWKDPNMEAFFDDLFRGYDGGSLSDHYKSRYDELNSEYGITWENSLKYSHSVRQADPLHPDQIIGKSKS